MSDSGADPSAALDEDGAITENLSRVVRRELELAKADVMRELLTPGRRPAMLAGAGFAAYMTALFVSIAVWWGLSNVMDQGWAALIVAVVWAVLGAVLYLASRRRRQPVRRDRKPESTIDTAWGRAPVR